MFSENHSPANYFALLCIFSCLSTACVILINHKKSRIFTEVYSVLGSLFNFIFLLATIYYYNPDKSTTVNLWQLTPLLKIGIKIDSIGLLFALTASFLWLMNTVYAIGYLRAENDKKYSRFYFMFAISMLSVMLGAFAANLFTLFIAYEFLTLSTIWLVYHKQNIAAKSGTLKYIVYLLGASVLFLLPGVLLVFHLSGNFDFAAYGLLYHTAASKQILWITFLLLIFGFSKSAIFPFHAWLPAAMVAPTPVSAFLHAVAVVKMGVFCVIRVMVNIFGFNLLQEIKVHLVLIALASFTIIFASIMAVIQNDIKKMLAYSTIGQLSYVIAGSALLSQQAFTGALLHMIFHALAKITLFFCAGSLYLSYHKTAINSLKGIAYKMPITMSAYTLAALSIIGIPPLCGFWSKWWIIQGALNSGNYVIIIAIVISTLLSSIYLLRVSLISFMPVETREFSLDNVSKNILLPICIGASLTMILFWQSYAMIKLP